MEMPRHTRYSVYASDASGEAAASCNQYAPRVPAVAGSFWEKRSWVLLAAAALEERCGTSRPGKPAAPVIAHERRSCGARAYKPHHKHTVVKHRLIKQPTKKPNLTRNIPPPHIEIKQRLSARHYGSFCAHRIKSRLASAIHKRNDEISPIRPPRDRILE